MQIRILRPLLGRRDLRSRLIGVPGTHNGRVNEFVDAVGRNEKLRISELGLDLVSRHDVGHVHLKDVGPLLLQKRSPLPFLFCLFVGLTSLLPLLDLGLDGSLADGHSHAIDGGPGGCREDIDGFKGFPAFVLVDLPDNHVCNDTGNLDFYRRGLERHPIHGGVFRLHKKVRGKRPVRALRCLSRRDHGSRPGRGTPRKTDHRHRHHRRDHAARQPVQPPQHASHLHLLIQMVIHVFQCSWTKKQGKGSR